MNAEHNEPRACAPLGLAAWIAGLRGRLPASAARAPLPADLEASARQVAAGEDLPAKFVRAATAVGLELHPASPADWIDIVRDVLRRQAARSVVVQIDEDSPLGEHASDELCKRLSGEDLAATTALDDETLFAADAAVTGVAAAIAETGTLVCSSGPAAARGASLIPPVHVALVHVSQLIPDLCDCLGRLSAAADLPANISLITGPSKTSDIEGILVTGVHGPGQVHVLLVSP